VTLQHPRAELSAYLDGALDPAAKAAVDGHLDTCALCRAHLAQLRATIALVHALPDPVPSRRLVPRLGVPVWLAPLRTLMTLASGAAAFLFIASALVSNITFLASSGAPTTAQEASRDTAANAQAPRAAATAGVPAPASTPATGFALGPTTSPAPDAKTSVAAGGAAGTATPDPRTRLDQTTAAASAAPVVVAPQEPARTASSEPARSPLVNPWLWLTLTVISGAIAIALHRRLRASA
jgi:hypothetical protein